MAFTNDPALARDRIRLRVGDTDPLDPFLDDLWYEYYLENNQSNETRAAIDCAKAILARFSRNSREKVDQVEIYGNLQFEQYLSWLKSFVSDPDISGLAPPMPFAGGISKSRIEENRRNSDNVSAPTRVGYAQENDNYSRPYSDRNPLDFKL